MKQNQRLSLIDFFRWSQNCRECGKETVKKGKNKERKQKRFDAHGFLFHLSSLSSLVSLSLHRRLSRIPSLLLTSRIQKRYITLPSAITSPPLTLPPATAGLAAGFEGAAAAAAATAAAGRLGFLGSLAEEAEEEPPPFFASSQGVTQARAEAWRALSSDSAEALLFWLVREKETEEGKEN